MVDMEHATDEHPTIVDANPPVDPTDFSEDADFARIIDLAFDVATRYGVTQDDVARALQAAVAEGDQR